MTTSNDILNQALFATGYDGQVVTGQNPTFDASKGGQAGARFYQPVVSAVMRQFAWDFARMIAALTTTGNTAPFPWSFEYGFPANAIQVNQLTPASLSDANNPLPVDFVVGNAQVSGVAARVIWTNLTGANVVYTGYAQEGTWDALFRESVVRLLGSVCVLSLAGKPEAAQALLETYAPFEKMGEGRTN